MNNRYANRDVRSLEPYYTKHTQAMTRERLEGKSEIAAELAHRDCLIAAARLQHQEMQRYLPVLERAEADPALWDSLTAGLGIATLAGYRHAIATAEGKHE